MPTHPETFKDKPEAPVLTPAQTKALKAQAHHLSPVVMIGAAGLTDSVLAEISVALTAHELIKVRVAGDDRDERKSIMARICDELACAPVQSIGKQLVLYRKKPDTDKDSDIHVPKQLAAEGKKPGPGRRGTRKAGSARTTSSRTSSGRSNTSAGKARAKPRKLSRNEQATGGRGGTNKRGRKKAGTR
jgi:putative YhbY family RNA-binding protein